MMRVVALMLAPAMALLLKHNQSQPSEDYRPQTCPSTEIKAQFNGQMIDVTKYLPPGGCVNTHQYTQSDGYFELCGSGKWVVSRMTCQNHLYKAVTVVQPPDQFAGPQDCKQYQSHGTVVDGFIGSVTYTCPGAR